MTERGKKVRHHFSDKLHKKHVSGNLYILIGIDRYRKGLVVRMCKQTAAKEIINFLKIVLNFHEISKKRKSNWGKAFISKDFYKKFKIKISNYKIVHVGYTPVLGWSNVQCKL